MPITLPENVNGKIDKLIKQGHIEKVENSSYNLFGFPIVITAKKDSSTKNSQSRHTN